MRQTYLALIELLGRHAQTGADSVDISRLAAVINSDAAPARDQDIIDFLAEFVIFLWHSPQQERTNSSGMIADWEDFSYRIRELKKKQVR